MAKNDDKLVSTTITFPENLMNQVKAISGVLCIPVSQFMREAASDFVATTVSDTGYQSKVQDHLAAQAAILTGSDSQ